MEHPSRLEENLDALTVEMGVLKQLKDKIVSKGGHRMEKWVHDVEGKESEVDEIRKDLNELNKGFRLNKLNARLKLNNKVIETRKAVKVLKERVNDNSESIETFMKGVSQDKVLRFTHVQLMKYTSNCETPIGSGGFGDVYKGELPNGVKIAVKVIKDGLIDVMEKQFKTEVSTMGKIIHRNLVKFYGFCFDARMKALVYEYMENGSLDMIYEKYPSIPWEKLYSIATGTARGIHYLHDSCDERIIHHDIKAGNVLLDSDYSPKVTDFGLAKLCRMDKSHVSLTKFRGTPSHAAPEVFMNLPKITYKSDVFSFGMMLFEILGRNCKDQKSFPKTVWEKFEKGHLDELLKNCGIGEEDKESARTLSIVALWCTQYLPKARPSMGKVVMVLEGEIEFPPPPKPFLPIVS